MPIFDLRDKSELQNLDPLAVFKALAIMCYPRDAHRRERMLGTIQKETGVNKPRRSPLKNETFQRELGLHNVRGTQTGSLMLILIQLRLHGYEPSLRLAIKLQRDTLLPEWKNAMATSWGVDSHLDHLPRSREIIMRNARNYAPVAHLWGAHLQSLQAGENPMAWDQPSWPNSIQGFLRFLGYAELFWDLEARAKRPRGTGERFFGAVNRWKIIVPDHMVVRPRITALPIPAWLSIITTYRKPNS
jgi:hypothetical protein